MRRFVFTLLAALGFAFTAFADTPLSDAKQEERAQSLFVEIRCPVCENEPISQSHADMAADMRAAVRKQVEEGKTDDDIRAFFRARYGDFVLLRPEIDAATILLWLTPLLMLLGGGAIVLSMRKRPSDLVEDGDDPGTPIQN
jgi:cytochrome c-type biogenesis protein CcmH